MKLDSIATFVMVVQSGSLSEAARRLRISRSVVSERLVDLEKELGTSLIQRTTRKVTVTENGTAFLSRAIRILREVEEATADLAERRGSLSGPLRISAPATFGRMHLGPALFPFLVHHPEIQLTLDLNDRRVDAAADGFDAVIRHGPIPDSLSCSTRHPDLSERIGRAQRHFLYASGSSRLAVCTSGGNKGRPWATGTCA